MGLNVAPNDPLKFLESVFYKANDSIYQYTKQGNSNMGTTLIVGLLLGGTLFIAHVGDSRAYLITRDQMKRLTEDHSWVAEQFSRGIMTEEEAKVSERRNEITRFIGSPIAPEVTLYEKPVQRKEIYLFCTDGLHGYVCENVIHRCVCRSFYLRLLCSKLIRKANSAGGGDNITVALLKIK